MPCVKCSATAKKPRQTLSETTERPRMTIYAKVIADSVSAVGKGKRITTLELQYQRFIHGELMTHRVFSRNAMSSRAVPVAKMIQQVRENPATPVHWGKNQPGMQAGEQLEGLHLDTAKSQWSEAAWQAANLAEEMLAIGLHKQVANRILEPFQWMRTLVTATEWDNFFELRCHPDAQPEFQALACMIRDAMNNSTPKLRHTDPVYEGAWHLPYVSDREREVYRADLLRKLSTARCARVSYLTHDGQTPDIDKDLELYERLVGSAPLHASPAEHQAYPFEDASRRCRNFVGWSQHRAQLDGKGWLA